MTWTTWRDIPAVCLQPSNLRRALVVTVGVGSVLFAINQLDVVLSGHANAVVWLKAALTYLVPFCVYNIVLLVATRRAVS